MALRPIGFEIPALCRSMVFNFQVFNFYIMDFVEVVVAKWVVLSNRTLSNQLFGDRNYTNQLSTMTLIKTKPKNSY